MIEKGRRDGLDMWKNKDDAGDQVLMMIEVDGTRWRALKRKSMGEVWSQGRYEKFWPMQEWMHFFSTNGE